MSWNTSSADNIYAPAHAVANNTVITGIWNTSTTTGPLFGTPEPCALGHQVPEDLIEYVDGTLVANCSECGTRIQLARVPGGVSMVRAKALLAGLLNVGTESEVVDESELLGMFAALQKEIDAEEYALEEARELLDLSRKILTKKVERQ